MTQEIPTRSANVDSLEKLIDSRMKSILDESFMWLNQPGEADRRWFNDFYLNGQYDDLRGSSENLAAISSSVNNERLEIEALLERISAISRSYRRKKAMLSPIRRMPTELLVRIFSDLQVHQQSDLPGQGESPASYPLFLRFASPSFVQHPIAQVCKQWRSIFSQSPFESRITVVGRNLGGRYAVREGFAPGFSGGSVCTNLSRFIRFRSGSTHLRISVSSDASGSGVHVCSMKQEKCPYSCLLRYLNRWSHFDLRCVEVPDCLNPLFEPTHLALHRDNLRAITLHLNDRESSSGNDWELAADGIATISFPNLIYLKIFGQWHHRFFLFNAPKLASLEVNCGAPTSGVANVFEWLSKCFPSLKHLSCRLSFIGARAPRSISSLEVTIPIHSKEGRLPCLEQCPQLRSIGIKDYRHAKSPCFIPLNCAEILSYASQSNKLSENVFANSPNLRHCRLQCYTSMPNKIEMAKRYHAHLSSLLQANNGTLLCPQLEALELHWEGADPDLLLKILSERRCNPQLKLTWKVQAYGFPIIENAEYEDFCGKLEKLSLEYSRPNE
jgi:hypothetical protein